MTADKKRVAKDAYRYETPGTENRLMRGSLYKKVGLASLVMMTSVVLSRLIGIFREMFIAYFGGASGDVDAYQVAFVIPEILNHVAASGFLSVTFIPIFSRYLVQEKEAEGWKVFSSVLVSCGSALVLLILVSMVWAGFLVDLIAPGLNDPAVKALSVRMTRIILPAQFFFFAGGLFMAVQFSKERFLVPAMAPLVYNLGIILGGFLLGPGIGIEGFSWGVLGGAFAGNFLLQLIGAWKAGMKVTFLPDVRHPDLREYVLVTLPLILGLTMTFSTEFLFKFFGSYLPRGTIAAMNYALRTMFILTGLFGQAVGTASFPYMARLVAEQRLKDMNALLNKTLKVLSLVIPLSFLLMVLRHEVILILFQRGRFDEAATTLTSHLLLFLLPGAFAFSAQTIVVRGYYATQNTLFPSLFGTVAVLLSIPFFLLGMKHFGGVGISTAISLSATFQVIFLYALWNRKTGNTESSQVYAFVSRILVLGIVLGIISEVFLKTVFSGIQRGTFGGSLLICILESVLFIGLLLCAGRVLGITEIQDLVHAPWKRTVRHS
jgi:putative peptidoglycan lipid II flippase